MDTSDATTPDQAQAQSDVVTAGERTVGKIAERLGTAVRASRVYGDPVEFGGVTVIPVARARWGFGGGGGGSEGDQHGSGGGGGAMVSPIGYIEIHADGTTSFRRIVATQELAAIIGLSLVAALAAIRIIRG